MATKDHLLPVFIHVGRQSASIRARLARSPRFLRVEGIVLLESYALYSSFGFESIFLFLFPDRSAFPDQFLHFFSDYETKR